MAALKYPVLWWRDLSPLGDEQLPFVLRWVLVRPAQHRGGATPLRGSCSPPFRGGLSPVMPPAERSKVGFSVVVAGNLVIYVRRWFGAAASVVVCVRAAVAVALQDAPSARIPIARQAALAIRTYPASAHVQAPSFAIHRAVPEPDDDGAGMISSS